MHSTHARARLVALIAALPARARSKVHGPAQDPALEVLYTKLEPKEQFKYKWKGAEAVCTAGVFRWEVTRERVSHQRADRNFTGYARKVLVRSSRNKTYRFRMNSIYAPRTRPRG